VRATARWRDIESMYPNALTFPALPLPQLLAGVNALRSAHPLGDRPIARTSPLLSVTVTKQDLAIWSGRTRLERLVVLRRSEIVGTDATCLQSAVPASEPLCAVRIYVFRAGGIVELVVPLRVGSPIADARRLADAIVTKMGVRLIASRQ
jgi:hypothetical protein